MKIIDRYIGLHTIRGVILVLSLLVILFSFMELMAQINDVGKGNYRLADAFSFVIFTVPKRIVDLLPVCILLGSIIALGLLADHQELTAMAASGVPVVRICLSVLAAGGILIVFAFMIAEFLAPPLDQQARIKRSQLIYGKGVMITKSGFWTRHGHTYIHVGRTIESDVAADIEIYEFDDEGRLSNFTYAREAAISADRKWLLKNIKQRIFTPQGIQTKHILSSKLDEFLSIDQVAVLELPPDSLSISDLYQYVRGLQERGQNADRHELSFWQKLSLPFSIMTMLLLALSFIFGPTRAITAGRRIIQAALVGVALYLLNQVVSHVGLLFGLHPALTTMVPLIAIAGISIWLLRNIR